MERFPKPRRLGSLPSPVRHVGMTLGVAQMDVGLRVELPIHLEGVVVEVDTVDAHPDQLVEVHREQLLEHGETLVTGDEARDMSEVEYAVLGVFDDPFALTDVLPRYSIVQKRRL